MPPRIRTTMTLDGEKEYKAALSEINSALKVLNSEMKLTKEQFSDQADSVEALTAEHDVPGTAIASPRRKRWSSCAPRSSRWARHTARPATRPTLIR